MPEPTETKTSPETVEPQQLELETQPPAEAVNPFAEAEKLLEVDTSETPKPPAKPPATVEEELEIVDDGKPAPEVKTEPETPPETEPEPKKSKRELFKEKAEADKEHRDKETKLKEREAAFAKREEELKSLETAFREFQADPIAYLDKTDPAAYEKWTERNLSGGAKRENPEMAEMRQKIEELQKQQEEKLSAVEKSTTDAQNAQYLNEAKSVLMSEDFKTAREDAEIWENFTGQPVNIERAIAERHDEFLVQYGKKLTPAECCEIINEDAQAHLERLGSFIEFVATKKPDIFKQSKTVAELFGQTPAKETPKTAEPPKTPATLTNEQETQSVPAGGIDPSKYNTKQEYLEAVANATLEHAE